MKYTCAAQNNNNNEQKTGTLFRLPDTLRLASLCSILNFREHEDSTIWWVVYEIV